MPVQKRLKPLNAEGHADRIYRLLKQEIFDTSGSPTRCGNGFIARRFRTTRCVSTSTIRLPVRLTALRLRQITS